LQCASLLQLVVLLHFQWLPTEKKCKNRNKKEKKTEKKEKEKKIES